MIIFILISCMTSVFCEAKESEWFQTGNTLPVKEFLSKQSSELKDNRVGSQWTGLWQPASYTDILHDEILGGLKRVRLSINHADVDRVNWTYPEFIIDRNHDEWITEISDNGVKITYILSFWDKAGRAEGHTGFWNSTGEFSYSRFKSEDEIQRYLDFVRFIVRHFKDRIEYYEILNEPETPLPGSWVEVEDYVNLVKRTAPVIRQEYPEAKIIAGATSDLEYLNRFLQSNALPLLDAISWHPMYGTSPEHESEKYYNYVSIVQNIKDIAHTNGFTGEFIADEINWQSSPQSNNQHTYSEIIAVKYYLRGILSHLGMNITVGFVEYPHPFFSAIHNLCTMMSGAKVIDIPVKIRSEAANIKSHSFSLPNGDRLIALWTDGVAVNEDSGVRSNLTFQEFGDEYVMGVDVLNSIQQPLVTSTENGSLVIQNLIVRDYPVILRFYSKPSSSITCSVSESEIVEGTSITISGVIDPALSNKNITLTCEKPDGSKLNKTVTTGSEITSHVKKGEYSYSFVPDVVGSWSVIASWMGDYEYKGASSLSESFVVKEQEQPASGCLIATATYGSELSPEVMFLRKFRDNYVLNSFAGKSFMSVFNKFYYSFSPSIASIISNNQLMREATKIVLYPLIGILHISSTTYSVFNFNQEFGVIIAGFIISSLIAIIYLLPPIVMISYLTNRQQNNRVTQTFCSIWIISILLMTLGEITLYQPLMMVSTVVFMIATAGLIITFITNKLIKHS